MNEKLVMDNKSRKICNHCDMSIKENISKIVKEPIIACLKAGYYLCNRRCKACMKVLKIKVSDSKNEVKVSMKALAMVCLCMRSGSYKCGHCVFSVCYAFNLI